MEGQPQHIITTEDLQRATESAEQIRAWLEEERRRDELREQHDRIVDLWARFWQIRADRQQEDQQE